MTMTALTKSNGSILNEYTSSKIDWKDALTAIKPELTSEAFFPSLPKVTLMEYLQLNCLRAEVLKNVPDQLNITSNELNELMKPENAPIRELQSACAKLNLGMQRYDRELKTNTKAPEEIAQLVRPLHEAITKIEAVLANETITTALETKLPKEYEEIVSEFNEIKQLLDQPITEVAKFRLSAGQEMTELGKSMDKLLSASKPSPKPTEPEVSLDSLPNIALEEPEKALSSLRALLKNAKEIISKITGQLFVKTKIDHENSSGPTPSAV